MPIAVLILIPVFIGLCAGVGAYMDGQVPGKVISGVERAFYLFGATFTVAMVLRVIASAAQSTAQVFGGLKYVAYTMPISTKRYTQVERGSHGSYIAYRLFEVMPDGVLASVGNGASRPNNPITGRPAWSYRGGWNISDRVPTLNNEAGIYGAKTPDSPILKPYRRPGRVLARCEFSGRVVEGEYGYRAQRCRVLDIIEEIF